MNQMRKAADRCIGVRAVGGAARRGGETSSYVSIARNEQGVKADLGLRDVELSRRHRMYGCDLPACDLDHVLIEYRGDRPRALIEYKLGAPRWLDLQNTNLKALRYLANAARIPCFLVFYEPLRAWRYTVIPLNTLAFHWFRRRTELSEVEYVRLLYKLRGREIPTEIAKALEVRAA